MSRLHELQGEHRIWLEHNFPHQENHDPLLGMMEEVGELSHAHLKFQQGIRGVDWGQYRAEAEDALGDLFIYMMSYCNTNDFDLGNCIEHTWDKVKQRDWKAHPEQGTLDESLD